MKPLNTQKFLFYIKALAVFALICAAYQNCGRPRFSIDAAAKTQKIGDEPVFGRDPGVDPNAQGPDRDPGVDPCGTNTTNKFKVSFSFDCSNSQSEHLGGNLLTTEAVKLVVVANSGNKVACELKGDFRSEILNTKSLSFAGCPNLPVGSYKAYILDVNSASASFKELALNKRGISFSVTAAGGLCPGKTKAIDLLYDFNSKDNDYAATIAALGGNSNADTQKKCDSHKSPLVVSLGSQARGVQLTSPLDGIQFDILGQRSTPFAHAPKQISWLTREDQGYYFITLPNQHGEVNGINELFGDNTQGPDGGYAANGYLALGKYDTDLDGLITDRDEIFSRLRLWNDRNRDGRSDPSELFTMSDKSIVVIDLDYDRNYLEEDIYGNRTMMKSVVKTEDGELHLMFDLWFRVLNITK
ncbi:hypothetical protein D3C87_1276920 [compost metagenome]